MKQPTAIECIGHTPLMAIPHFCEQEEALACVLVKLEKSNPFGSVKDRAALYIIRELEKAGRLTPGGCIVEPTSGNTGVGLAAIGACRGYRVVLTMPASMSCAAVLSEKVSMSMASRPAKWARRITSCGVQPSRFSQNRCAPRSTS